jgi:hypothetical protein
MTAISVASRFETSCETPNKNAPSERRLLPVRRSSAAPLTETSARIETGSTKSRIALAWMSAQARKKAILSTTVMKMKSVRSAPSVALGIDSQSIANPKT